MGEVGEMRDATNLDIAGRSDSVRTKCGYFLGSSTEILVSLVLRYWSTVKSVPVIVISFFSSTTTFLPVSALKKEKNCCRRSAVKR